MYRQQSEIVTVSIYHDLNDADEERRVYVASNTTIGKRKSQQDDCRYCMEHDVVYAIVCDGMGGMKGGERASKEAVHQFDRFFHDEYPIADIPTFMEHAVKIMDRSICKLTNEDGKPLGGGSTMIAAMIKDNLLYWASVGDSKIYLIRGNEMVCVTREHNYRLLLSQYYEEGTISAEEYVQEDKQGDALISYLGMGVVKMTDINAEPFELEPGDQVLLCSDGVYKTLSEETIQRIMANAENNMETAVCNIIQCIEEADNPTQDNATVIAMIYQPN